MEKCREPGCKYIAPDEKAMKRHRDKKHPGLLDNSLVA
jgi:hypothetical protein